MSEKKSMGLPHILNTITKTVFKNKNRNKYFHHLRSMTKKNIITLTFEMQLHQGIFKTMLLKWRVKIRVHQEYWE
jgi:hypothetical protein